MTMKKIMYEVGPDRIEVGGIGFMNRGEAVEVPDDKALDMLTNPMFKESLDSGQAGKPAGKGGK